MVTYRTIYKHIFVQVSLDVLAKDNRIGRVGSLTQSTFISMLKYLSLLLASTLYDNFFALVKENHVMPFFGQMAKTLDSVSAVKT